MTNQEFSHKRVEEYILSMPNVKLEYPFGEEVAVYKYVPTEASEGETGPDAEGGVNPDADGGVNPDANGRVNPDANGRGKMFALIQEGSDPLRLSLKCDPLLANILRDKYETVLPGYHLNKKHWNTVILSGQLPWEEVEGLIRHSYELVSGSDE